MFVKQDYIQYLLDSTTIMIKGSNSYTSYSSPLNQLIPNQNFNMIFTLNEKLNNQLNGSTSKDVSLNIFINIFIQFFDTNDVLKGYIGPNGYIFSDLTSATDWYNGAGDATHINYDKVNLPYQSNHIYSFQNLQFANTGSYIFKLCYYNGSANIPIEILNTTFIDKIYEASCFNEGTEILILNKEFKQEYVPVETIKRGDLVKSYKHGYRKIELIGKNKMVNQPETFGNCMYRMIKTDTNDLTKDLTLTGWHSILVDSLGDCEEENKKFITGQIDHKYLLLCSVSKEFKKIETHEEFTYYHFCLENDGDVNNRYGVYANGMLTETPSQKDYILYMNLLSY